MDLRFALALLALPACAATPPPGDPPGQPPLIAERSVSLYAQQHAIVVTRRTPTTVIGIDADDRLDVRGVLIRFDNGDEEALAIGDNNRITIPGPARKLHTVSVVYASDAPPETFANVRLYDMSNVDTSGVDPLGPRPRRTARR